MHYKATNKHVLASFYPYNSEKNHHSAKPIEVSPSVMVDLERLQFPLSCSPLDLENTYKSIWNILLFYRLAKNYPTENHLKHTDL